jgi:hypothetical protein
MEFQLLAAVPKRRQYVAAAILGHKLDLAMPGSVYYLGLFFLQRKIYLILSVPHQALPRPSGFIPGLARSGCAWRLIVAGEVQGFNRVCTIALWVFSVTMKDLKDICPGGK